MCEWHLISVLVGFAAGFGSGLLYALRLYKRIEAESDREWAKRGGMREVADKFPGRMIPVLRQRVL